MVFALFVAASALALFVYPLSVVVLAIYDPHLNAPGIPRLALHLHEQLSPRYENWAVSRVAGGRASRMSLGDVAGTEWPLFGSVFYLLAEEAMQDAWEQDHRLLAQEPRIYARGAIEAAARLVADPAHATWVRHYWGEEYLARENVFFRMMLISALASHGRLTGSDEFHELLRQQSNGLAAELAASPYGWLNDYPRQCYPADVVAAWNAIQRADRVLGTDHTALIALARRGFTGERVGELGLPPFEANAESGRIRDSSRGCSNSAACIWAATLWPDLTREWYQKYEQHFWQRDWLTAGFREYPRGDPHGEYTFDVDAGPVIRGQGFAASAFGVAAARLQGRFDHAYPMSLEMIAMSWPLPGGRLLLPDLVSDSTHAPLIGEAAIFFQLTRPTLTASRTPHRGAIPAMVLLCVAVQFFCSVVALRLCVRTLRRARRAWAEQRSGTARADVSATPPA